MYLESFQMIGLKQERLADSRKRPFLFKILMAGLLCIGFLPFSLAQDYNLRHEIETRFKKRYHTEEFKKFLDSMEIHGKEYFAENCSQKASLIRNKGRVEAYRGYEFYTNSYDFYYQAFEAINNCNQKDSKIYLQILMNLASFNAYRGDQPITFQEIIDEIDRVINTEEYYVNDIKFEKLAANGHYQIAEYYRYHLRDYDRALIHNRKSMAIYNKYPIVDKKPLRPINSIIMTYTESGKVEESIKYIDQSIMIANKLKLTEPRYTSNLKFEIGKIYIEQKEYRKLDSLHKVILALYPDKVLYQISYQKGMAYYNQGEYQKASNLLSETLSMLDKYGTKDEQILIKQISDFQSECMLHLKIYEKALPFALTSMKESSARLKIDENSKMIFFDDLLITNPLDFLSSSNTYLESITLGDMISEKDFISTIDKFDSIYFEIQPTLAGPLSANILADYYHEMVGIALKHVQKYNTKKHKDFIAYYLSSGKSLSLFSDFIVTDNIPTEYVEEYNTLVSQRDVLSSAIAAASKNNEQERLDSLATDRYEVNLSLKKIYDKLNDKNLSSQYRINREKAVDNLKANFNSGELLIDFLEYANKYYAYSFFENEINFYQLDLDFLQGKSFKSAYTNVEEYKNLELITEELSAALSILFPDNIDNIKSLIIIPDGPLLEIPFETVLYKGKELIQYFPIHYLNSINDHYKRSESHSNSTKSYMGFGLTYGSALLNNIKSSTEIESLFDESYDLASLPNAIDELEMSNSIFKGNLFLEEDCTVENFVAEAGKANIIHIANHVLLNNSNSFLSSIVFAKDEKEQLFNGLDIKALDLSAQLAILSSCNSGVGENFSGNGLRSIGQSFFEAGCQSVIVNLWEAGDKSSKKIISAFMHYLQEGMPKSAALRQAKLDFLSQASAAEKHPKFWANIVLIGNDDPVSFSGAIPKWIYLVAGAVVLLVIMGAVRKKKEAA